MRSARAVVVGDVCGLVLLVEVVSARWGDDERVKRPAQQLTFV